MKSIDKYVADNSAAILAMAEELAESQKMLKRYAARCESLLATVQKMDRQMKAMQGQAIPATTGKPRRGATRASLNAFGLLRISVNATRLLTEPTIFKYGTFYRTSKPNVLALRFAAEESANSTKFYVESGALMMGNQMVADIVFGTFAENEYFRDYGIGLYDEHTLLVWPNASYFAVGETADLEIERVISLHAPSCPARVSVRAETIHFSSTAMKLADYTGTETFMSAEQVGVDSFKLRFAATPDDLPGPAYHLTRTHPLAPDVHSRELAGLLGGQKGTLLYYTAEETDEKNTILIRKEEA